MRTKTLRRTGYGDAQAQRRANDLPGERDAVMQSRPISKQQVLDMMKRFGLEEFIAAADAELPDPVD
jgi:hypothetical protein